MRNNDDKNHVSCLYRPGVVLVLTLVILVVLSVLAYTLTSRVASQQHRDQYIIDYQAARYACDSALKYSLATVQNLSPRLISRPNEPDFSDLFALTEEEYQELLDEWARTRTGPPQARDVNDVNETAGFNDIAGPGLLFDVNAFSADSNAVWQMPTDINDVNEVTIRGPYGPAWPLATEPIELEIGSAKVTITIEDENAKMPISWGITGEKEFQRQAQAALQTFCEWMQMDTDQIDDLQSQLEQVAEIKPFKLDLKAITTTEKVKQEKKQPRRRRRVTRRGRRSRRAKTKPKKRTRPASAHAADFARLFHSSLVDTETLARPIIESEQRNESALKYLGMWGSKKVNINSAPRHVLESAFTFGGDEVEIADEIIKKRRNKPFKDIGELRKLLYKYADSITKTEKYITTSSTLFTIRVRACSGVAKTSAVASVAKDGKKVEKLAILFE